MKQESRREILFELDAARESELAESFHMVMEKVLDKQAEENMVCYSGLLLCPRTLICTCMNHSTYHPGEPEPRWCSDATCHYCVPAREDYAFWKAAFERRERRYGASKLGGDPVQGHVAEGEAAG